VANQYLVGSVSFCGRSISSHSSARGSLSLVPRCAGRTRCCAKREARQSALPSRHVMACQASAGRPESEGLCQERLMLPVAPKQLGWSSAAAAPVRVAQAPCPAARPRCGDPCPRPSASREWRSRLAVRCRCHSRHPSAPHLGAAPPLSLPARGPCPAAPDPGSRHPGERRDTQLRHPKLLMYCDRLSDSHRLVLRNHGPRLFAGATSKGQRWNAFTLALRYS
jgi:hypothetical protein